MSSFIPPGECPVCGAQVSAGAKACPECGSCKETGWNEEAEYSGLDLPSADTDESSHQEEAARKPAFVPVLIVVVLALILSGLWFIL